MYELMTKTKLVKIPKELGTAKDCEITLNPSCCRTPEYFLAIKSTCKLTGLEFNKGMFLCKLHKNPRIRLWNDTYEGELHISAEWIIDGKTKNVVQKWPTEQKKGTYKVGEMITLDER